ncbi:MAG: glycosyltransferase [Candidatus Sumerlaeia bacterium]
MRWIIAGSQSLNSVLRSSTSDLARGIAAGLGRLVPSEEDSVFYFPAPISPWHYLLKGRDARFQERKGAWGFSPEKHGENLLQYTPFTLFPAINTSIFRKDKNLRRSLGWTLPSLRRVIDKAGFMQPDVLIVNNLQYAWLDEIVKPACLVYRCVDDIRGFEGVPQNLINVEASLIERCDLCTVLAWRMAEIVMDRGAKEAEVISLGVDAEHFNPRRARPEPEKLRDIPRPRLLFVGTLNERIDMDWIETLARERPDYHLVLVGPLEGGCPAVPDRANIHALGPRPYDAIPAWMQHCDAGLIPFRHTPLVESTNPIKLYQYLAAGLPVASRRWLELEKMQAPLHLADDAEGFVRAVDAALGDKNIVARLAFARSQSWDAKITELRQAIAAVL